MLGMTTSIIWHEKLECHFSIPSIFIEEGNISVYLSKDISLLHISFIFHFGSLTKLKFQSLSCIKNPCFVSWNIITSLLKTIQCLIKICCQSSTFLLYIILNWTVLWKACSYHPHFLFLPFIWCYSSSSQFLVLSHLHAFNLTMSC